MKGGNKTKNKSNNDPDQPQKPLSKCTNDLSKPQKLEHELLKLKKT